MFKKTESRFTFGLNIRSSKAKDRDNVLIPTVTFTKFSPSTFVCKQWLAGWPFSSSVTCLLNTNVFKTFLYLILNSSKYIHAGDLHAKNGM